MDKKHISDEILVAWIEESLPKSKFNSVSMHLEDCDKCYLRFSNLLESVKLSKNNKLEQVPTEIREYAKEQLGIDIVPSSKKESILSKIFHGILRPVPITAIAASIVLLFFIINNIETTTETAPFVTTSKELSPVSVAIENDSLIVSQPLNVRNNLLIMNVIGDTLFTDELSGFRLAYPMEIFDNHDIVRLQVSSHGVIILDTTLNIDQH